MLNSVKTLTGFRLMATDGELGKVSDFYFDDKHWAVRYLVASTGGWLSARLVLISPHSLGRISVKEEDIAVELSKSQIEGSPSIDADKPVSQQFEEQYYNYYGWPNYWGGPFLWGSYPYIMRSAQIQIDPAPSETHWNSHLRSAKEVEGYDVHALDGSIGHISDFIVDDDTWAIHYLVIDVSRWWQGKHLLISPQWTERVSWDDSVVVVNVTRETIKLSPGFDPSIPITPDIEQKLKQYYDSYWSNSADLHPLAPILKG